VTRALIGHTGFVGGTVLSQTPFEATYNSTNIEEIRRQRFDLIVCAGAPGRKWRANQHPGEDLASIQRLIEALDQTEARELILISTVDVYPSPRDVDEATPIDNARNAPYGRHRRLLEEFALARFPGVIVRLPGLFGRGLKKNIVYDFLHGNRVDQISPHSVFQFYDLTNLWSDINRCRESGIRVVNFATEPVSVEALASEVFDADFRNPSAPPPVRYDMWTRFAGTFGGRGHYLYGSSEILGALRQFVRDERAR